MKMPRKMPFPRKKRIHRSVGAAAAAVNALRVHGASVLSLGVLHDAACNPAQCVCRPHYTVERGTVEALAEGVRAEREWRKATAN